MPPELVHEFITAFHEELNRQRREQALGRNRVEDELRRMTAKLDGLYDAIADGLRTDGLKGKLEELESKKTELEKTLTDAPAPEPYLHPNLAGLYRDRVEALHQSLNEPSTRSQTAEILRVLIDRIEITFTENGPVAELIGDIVKLVSLPEGTDVPASFESSVKVVAGARNRRCLHFDYAVI